MILIEIDKILKKYNIKRETIDYIVFNRGPGSFTGTRVASSVIQAIAYTHNIPVIGISSMWLMAYQASRIRTVRSILLHKTCIWRNDLHITLFLTTR